MSNMWDDDEEKRVLWQGFWTFLTTTIVLAVICALLGGCAAQKPLVKIEYRDSVRIEQRLDSVYLYKHDSIFIDRWRSNDTIYITKERWAVRYKDKIVEIHDTITNESTTETEIAVPYVPAFYKWSAWVCWGLIALLLIWAAWKIVKLIYLRR